MFIAYFSAALALAAIPFMSKHYKQNPGDEQQDAPYRVYGYPRFAQKRNEPRLHLDCGACVPPAFGKIDHKRKPQRGDQRIQARFSSFRTTKRTLFHYLHLTSLCAAVRLFHGVSHRYDIRWGGRSRPPAATTYNRNIEGDRGRSPLQVSHLATRLGFTARCPRAYTPLRS